VPEEMRRTGNCCHSGRTVRRFVQRNEVEFPLSHPFRTVTHPPPPRSSCCTDPCQVLLQRSPPRTIPPISSRRRTGTVRVHGPLHNGTSPFHLPRSTGVGDETSFTSSLLREGRVPCAGSHNFRPHSHSCLLFIYKEGSESRARYAPPIRGRSYVPPTRECG